MLLYHGMYNIAHFEINNSVPLYTNTAVGDAYDYKRLRKVCFESGGAYINDSIIDGGHVKGGAHVTIQEDSIFLNIVPDNPEAGIVYGLTFFIGADDRTMYVYAEKREGGGGGDSGVNSFNGRRGSVVSADGDYNAGMVSYDNTNSGLVADDVQQAIDEVAYENENLSDDVEDLQTALQNLSANEVAYSNLTSGLTATDVQSAIDEIAAGTPSSGVTSFNGRSGVVNPAAGDYDKSMVGLANVDNTSDLNKPISTATQTALDLKANSADLATVATSGAYTDLTGTPTPYSLPIASASDLGGVKIGSGLSIDANGVVSATGGGTATDLSKTIAPVESGDTASRNYSIGELFIDKDGYLGNVKSTINSGGALTLGTNYTRLLESDFIKPGIIYTAVHDGTKTYRDLLNEISAYWSSLPTAIRFRCVVYMNRYIYRRAYSYGATNDYVVVKFSTTGVSYEQLSVTTASSHYRVKDENGALNTYDTTVSPYDIYLILNY